MGIAMQAGMKKWLGMSTLLSTLVVACSSGSGDSSNSASSGAAAASEDCPGVTGLICDRAADCAGDGKARLKSGPVSATHENAGECKKYYQFLGCPAFKSVDWASCKSAAATMACGDTSKGKALVLATDGGCKGMSL